MQDRGEELTKVGSVGLRFPQPFDGTKPRRSLKLIRTKHPLSLERILFGKEDSLEIQVRIRSNGMLLSIVNKTSMQTNCSDLGVSQNRTNSLEVKN